MTVTARPLMFFGTCNLDLCLKVEKLPLPGQSVMGAFARHPGGKGANQAVAAARLGLRPRLFTKLGDDDAGATLRRSLEEAGVRDDAIVTMQGGVSGTALILVDAAGANMIGIEAGANGTVSVADIEGALELIEPEAIVVAEMGLPNGALEHLFAQKADRGFTLIFNPAPVRPGLTGDAWGAVDYATPNETEISEITAIEVVDDASANRAASAMLEMGVRSVLLTLGSRGALYADRRDRFRVPAFRVEAVDTTAAGDAFNGGFAAALATGTPVERAIRYAMAVAALCVTQPGAQSAMPTRAAVDLFLDTRSILETI